MTFTQMLLETFETPRIPIKHLEDLPPLKFLKILEDLKNLKISDITVREKIDGSGIRFGFIDGKFYCETSYSGPFLPGHYSEIINQKFGYSKDTDFLKQFDELSEFLSQQKFLNVLKKYDNTKVVCEVLYNPLATENGDKLKFVHISYDKSKLGNFATLIPITVVDENGRLPNADEIINKIISFSNSDFKIISNKINMDLDFLFGVNDLKDILKSFGDVEYYLTSRKVADKPIKSAIIDIINIAKKKIKDEIISRGGSILGNESEGYVLELPGMNLKVTTDKFKKQMELDKSNFK